jgi:hypothetical protein
MLSKRWFSVTEEQDQLWRKLVDRIDGWLVPVALGCLSTLIVAQVVTSIPAVRRHVDSAAGRFVAMPADIVPASVNRQEAEVSLYISPAGDHSDVEIQVDGRTVGFMAEPKLGVSVREGDVISVVNKGTGMVAISVDHDNPNLLLPAPGQTLYVEPGETVSLPSARFAE